MDVDDGDAIQIGEALGLAIYDMASETAYDLRHFRRLRLFLKNETSHLPDFVFGRIKNAIEDFHEICESPIEMIALVKMMAINVAAEGEMPFFPTVTKKYEPRTLVTITPQVCLGNYRADFVVTNRIGTPFLVECDGADFHNYEMDAKRDEDIKRDFGMKTFRLTGKEIWSSDIWLSYFGHWCRGKMYNRCGSRFMQDLEALAND